MIQRERIIQEFVELCAISSPGGAERQIADRLKAILQSLSLQVEEDDAGVEIQGNTGNLFARLERTGPGPAIFFSAHMDTVVPCEKVVPVIRDGAVYSDGTTILGADDKAGIVAILEAIRILQETKEPHPTVEVVFTVQEEGGLKGAKAFDTACLESKMGYVLDSSGSAGSIVVSGPSQNHIEATIQGRAAHAGICPEEGISAIKVASRAVNLMKLGRIDAHTTANIGTINGGTATNIIPERVVIKGEARSLDTEKLAAQTRHMEASFQQAAREMGAEVEVSSTLIYPGLHLAQDEPVVALAVKAAKVLGLEPKLESTGGGSDANIFNGAGLPTANLGIGMQKVHTNDEFITLDDLEKNACYVLEIIRQAGK